MIAIDEDTAEDGEAGEAEPHERRIFHIVSDLLIESAGEDAAEEGADSVTPHVIAHIHADFFLRSDGVSGVFFCARGGGHFAEAEEDDAEDNEPGIGADADEDEAEGGEENADHDGDERFNAFVDDGDEDLEEDDAKGVDIDEMFGFETAIFIHEDHSQSAIFGGIETECIAEGE